MTKQDPTELSLVVATRVQQLREESEWSQQDLANEARFYGWAWSVDQVARLEQSRRRIQLDDLETLCKVFDTSLGNLILPNLKEDNRALQEDVKLDLSEWRRDRFELFYRLPYEYADEIVGARAMLLWEKTYGEMLRAISEVVVRHREIKAESHEKNSDLMAVAVEVARDLALSSILRRRLYWWANNVSIVHPSEKELSEEELTRAIAAIHAKYDHQIGGTP